jgi:diguanylate cyclase (GGDEF)-like protein
MHNKLTHQATHDELTGLINRKEFERELERILGVAKLNKTQHVVAFMDLDQFKVVNNTGGHDAGDRLLIELSEELSSKVDENTTLSRLGGDEFGILLEDCGKEVGMEAVKRICEVVKNFRFNWETDVFSLTTSCGVVNVDSETESVTSILRGADSACYVAKDAGRDRIQVYEVDDSQMEHRKEIMEFVSQIDNSLANDRFVLNCQKIAPIDKDSGNHDHYEILLTVLDENDNPLPPQDFIVAAETYNRMGAIDRWVIKNSFKFIASNILKLEHLAAFSINISGNSLTEDDFMEFVLEQFKETRLPTSKVCFEITETAAVGNLDQVIEFMEKMKVLGVQFSLDDFGTGLSSYSYLRNLPVDFLKIDGVFVKDILDNPNDYAVVKSINEIGHFMGKKTIAEFVENDEVLEVLREIGVDFAQGYGIGMKVPITELL